MMKRISGKVPKIVGDTWNDLYFLLRFSSEFFICQRKKLKDEEVEDEGERARQMERRKEMERGAEGRGGEGE